MSDRPCQTCGVYRETIDALTAQVMRLGQCVVCGEMDEQNGVRSGGSFYCAAHDNAPGVARLAEAAEKVLVEPYGCRFCDSGTLRSDGKDKGHDDDCGFAMLCSALAPFRGRKP